MLFLLQLPVVANQVASQPVASPARSEPSSQPAQPGQDAKIELSQIFPSVAAMPPMGAAATELVGLLPTIAESSSTNSQSFRFDGQVLFELGSTEAISAQQRSQLLTQTIQQIAKAKGASKQYRPLPKLRWQVEKASQQPVIYGGDRFLLTVTPQDAALNGYGDSALAADFFQRSLTTALENYRSDRQPASLRRQLRIGLALLGCVSLASFALQRQQKRLLRQANRSQPEPTAVSYSSTRDTVEIESLGVEQAAVLRKPVFRNPLNLSQFAARWQINAELKRWFVLLLQLGLWISCTLYLFSFIAPLRPWHPVLMSLLNLPFQLLLIGLGIKLANRLGALMIERLCLSLSLSRQRQRAKQKSSYPSPSQRLELRFSTLATVGKGIWTSSCIAGGIMLLLLRLGINLAPVLAGAGIIGLGLSLASQSLLKDIIHGFFILLEDQYGVGDVIIVGEVAGFVETMNLRITQLRNEEGRLITVPNSQINIVQNLSKEWSRVDLMIPIDNRVAVDRALGLVRQVAEGLAEDPHWRSLILDPTEVVGVEQLDHSGTSIRLWLKTLPLKQWDVAREYRRRLKQAFDASGIPLGAPHQIVELPRDHDSKAQAPLFIS